MKSNKINSFLIRIEPYFFHLLILITALPVICFKYFPTVDGAAHLYNSKLILELIRGNDFLSEYFRFNDLSPNWFGHIFLVGLLSIFPAFIAEKILILFYVIGLPIAFRGLIKSLPNQNPVMAYFVFPFIYSYLFYSGMYNFHLGIVFFFWALFLFVKYKGNYTAKRILILWLLSVLICLSHLFTISLFLLVIAILNLKQLKELTSDANSRSDAIKKLSIQLLFLSGGILLLLKFMFAGMNDHGDWNYINSSNLFQSLISVEPAKGINYGKAAIFSKWIFYSFVLILIYIVALNLYHFFSGKKSNLKNQGSLRNEWLLCTLISLVLLFTMPDGNSAFGFISSRLMLFFFLFLIVWLSTQKFPVWLSASVFIVIIYISIALLKIYFISTQHAHDTVKEINRAADNIQPNSVVLPLNYSDNMIFNHVSNYLGIDKPMVVLENYEAYLYYFPLGWNMPSMPQLLLYNQPTDFNCITWPKNGSNAKKIIDYIFIIRDSEQHIPMECSDKIKNLLSDGYILVYSNNDNKIQLYKHSL